ncbi:nucleotide exchange factor Fes1-domain-containing protein [Mycena belliarum]|uniref:Nucleotide exchange factor Fes1-domain-containing protein n=1 Tax=Mycena belliarum TaxID=1033014 RepID=A0AAD6U9P0_9AGAR|nr:nucleotide exchange factor Fes1-domain-containing protein [Mycena belliae]
MESLLRWGIENSTPQTDATNGSNPPAPRQDLDPAIIDMILGKSDAEQMKEDMAVAVDDSQSEAARIDALDHFEMLIEQIDNANNIEKLKMWSPLQDLITTAPTSAIKMQALWVIGTALQNNPAAQDAYFAYDPLPVLAGFLTPSPSSTAQTRSKAIYAMSGLLKHNIRAVAALSRPDVDGWGKLSHALQDPDLGIRRKAIFLLSTLLIPNDASPSASSSSHQQPIHANSHAASLADPHRTDTSAPALQALHAHGILDAVITGLTHPVPSGADGDVPGPDADFEERGVALLRTYSVACGRDFSPTQRKALRGWFEAERARDPTVAADRWGLSSGEFDALLAKVA